MNTCNEKPCFHDIAFYLEQEEKEEKREKKENRDNRFRDFLFEIIKKYKTKLAGILAQMPSIELPKKIPDIILMSPQGMPLLKYMVIQLTHCVIEIINTKNTKHKITKNEIGNNPRMKFHLHISHRFDIQNDKSCLWQTNMIKSSSIININFFSN